MPTKGQSPGDRMTPFFDDPAEPDDGVAPDLGAAAVVDVLRLLGYAADP